MRTGRQVAEFDRTWVQTFKYTGLITHRDSTCFNDTDIKTEHGKEASRALVRVMWNKTLCKEDKKTILQVIMQNVALRRHEVWVTTKTMRDIIRTVELDYVCEVVCN